MHVLNNLFYQVYIIATHVLFCTLTIFQFYVIYINIYCLIKKTHDEMFIVTKEKFKQ